MKLFVSLLFFVSASVLPILAQGGYYWRQYTGIVPDDALEAGRDNREQIIYIGMTLHPATVLLPGTIYPEAKKISYEYGLREHSTDLNVLILCTENKEQFSWTKVTAKGRSVKDVTKNNEFQIIQAGSDTQGLIYVGRTIIPGNENVVGKVLVVDGLFNYMFAVQDKVGKPVTDYEVLLYDPRVVVRKECGSTNSTNNITINVYSNNN